MKIVVQKPEIYNSIAEFNNLDNFSLVDTVENAIREFFSIQNPTIRKDSPVFKTSFEEFKKTFKIEDRFIVYTELKKIVRSVDATTYFRLRTARNRTIISEEEQIKYRSIRVGIAGLSVGSEAARALVISGGPQNFKLADFDVLEITNLNRITAGLPDVGTNKTEILAKYIWELDPDANLELWGKGLSHENIEEFILSPKIDIFIDALDDISLKFKAREICKANQIPVLMATDNGDSVILDIERFDHEPLREIFHGLVKAEEINNLDKLTYKEWLALATQIVGPELLTGSMQTAILEIGKSIPAVPQLGPTASLAGAGIAFAVRRIANNQALPSGRYTYGLDTTLIPEYENNTNQRARLETAETIRNKLKQ